MERLHRWLGIGIGLMLPVWFVTGAVISFEPFPSLAASHRLAASESLVLAGRDPAQALRSGCLRLPALAAASRLRLVAVDGDLRWIARGPTGDVACDVATGRVAAPINSAAAARIASRLVGMAAQRVDGPLEFDPWTVHDGYLAGRPYWRVSFDDGSATQVYVSRRTGELAQRTTLRQRAWNQIGARLHWLNLGTLRASPVAWHAVMRSVASLALALVCFGLLLGLRRAWQARRLARLRGSPFRGLMRVHHRVGLVAAWVMLAWLASGWMSLDQGTLFGNAEPAVDRVANLQRVTLAQAALALGSAPHAGEASALAGAATPLAGRSGPLDLAGAHEAEVVAFAGRARLLLRDDHGGSRVLEIAAGPVASDAPVLTDAELAGAVEHAWAPVRVVRIEALAANDAWARRDQPFPPGARRLHLDDAPGTWVHVDARSGQLLSVMDSGRRRYRWLVDGLHRLDFPLLNQAGAWHPLLLLGMVVGLGFSVTGIALGLRRLSAAPRRTVSRADSGASGTAS